MHEAVAYGLLLLDVAVGAAIIWIAVWLALRLAHRIRRSRSSAGGEQTSESTSPMR